ncbi:MULTISPECIES: hypothetical protein [Malaciobacter]|jgi:hypothetical protein|uniref:Lipoprotein n=2 Tax=Malaciobacter TaxID=2321114 RepID=A0AB36ZZJ6_9BACT|nr:MULTISPECIES: hypothetical protein [Malaciobacter]PHO08917.1 hypothetical protein CPG37_11920 [Malaciobacter canalis]PPK61270.1 hypothetical protein B0F89_11135 [Malaciobacter marinus]QEE32881.1 hypothetical protein ACAN_1400 [Malaciobacter canalis]SKB61026.1 hypothetical protein SAMN06295997_12335 [Malaciobacter marinus]
MKTTVLLFLMSLFIFVGCSQDISKFKKDDCIKKGYGYKKEKVLNYRTGKYELRTICIKK